MSAPAVIIVLRLEATPRVVLDALSESEAVRLVDWLESQDDYVRLVARALELEEERAA